MGKTIAFSGYRAEKLPENIDPIRVSLMDTVKQSNRSLKNTSGSVQTMKIE